MEEESQKVTAQTRAVVQRVGVYAEIICEERELGHEKKGYTYLGERTGPIKPLSQPLKRNFLPRPGHFNKRALPPHHF